MHSTLKLRDSDPHDDFAIVPDVVPATWADKVLADITRDAGGEARSPSDISSPSDIKSRASEQPRHPASGAAAVVVAPAVDTTFRATAIDDIPAPAEPPPTSRWVKSAVMLVFALCSAAAAAAWQNHGDAAKQMISNWVPAFIASQLSENAALAGPTEAPAAPASAAEQTAPQPVAPAPAPVQENAAAAAAAPSPDTAQLQSMAHDLAAMAQQVEHLKANIAELKAGQQAMARDVARTSEVKPPEVRPAVQNPRPRTSAPPRTAAARPHRPLPAHAPPQAAAPAPLSQAVPPPRPSTMPASMLPPPPQAATRTEDGEPIVRPPMPLR